MANYRNRKLLDLAHSIRECQNCGAYSPDGSEPAHSNWQFHGKGMSIKAHDCFFAALCHSCHAELDQGSKLDGEAKINQWQRAFDRTLLTLWEQGFITVKG